MSEQTLSESAVPPRMIKEGMIYLSRCGISEDPTLAQHSQVMQSMIATIMEFSGMEWYEEISEEMGERAVEYFDHYFDPERPEKAIASPSFVDGFLNYALLGTEVNDDNSEASVLNLPVRH